MDALLFWLFVAWYGNDIYQSEKQTQKVLEIQEANIEAYEFRNAQLDE